MSFLVTVRVFLLGGNVAVFRLDFRVYRGNLRTLWLCRFSRRFIKRCIDKRNLKQLEDCSVELIGTRIGKFISGLNFV